MFQDDDDSSAEKDDQSLRISELKERRQSERTKLILSASSKGDMESLKQALKVSNVDSLLSSSLSVEQISI